MIIACRYIAVSYCAVLRIVLALRHTTDVGSSVSVIVNLQSSVSAIHRIVQESGINHPGLKFKSLESQLCSVSVTPVVSVDQANIDEAILSHRLGTEVRFPSETHLVA